MIIIPCLYVSVYYYKQSQTNMSILIHQVAQWQKHQLCGNNFYVKNSTNWNSWLWIHVPFESGILRNDTSMFTSVLLRFSCFSHMKKIFNSTRNFEYTHILEHYMLFVYRETCCTIHTWSPKLQVSNIYKKNYSQNTGKYTETSTQRFFNFLVIITCAVM